MYLSQFTDEEIRVMKKIIGLDRSKTPPRASRYLEYLSKDYIIAKHLCEEKVLMMETDSIGEVDNMVGFAAPIITMAMFGFKPVMNSGTKKMEWYPGININDYDIMDTFEGEERDLYERAMKLISLLKDIVCNNYREMLRAKCERVFIMMGIIKAEEDGFPDGEERVMDKLNSYDASDPRTWNHSLQFYRYTKQKSAGEIEKIVLRRMAEKYRYGEE